MGVLSSLFQDLNDLRRVRHARKSASSLILPLVNASRKRLGPIPQIVWNEPYIIGFITTVVTAVAIDATRGRLTGDMLGNVQVSCWHDITGISNADIGDAILFLSRSASPEFFAGAEAAAEMLTGIKSPDRFLAFHPGTSEVATTGLIVGGDHAATGMPAPLHRQIEILELSWRDAFEEPVMRYLEALRKLSPGAAADE